jgi:hypothetical protein
MDANLPGGAAMRESVYGDSILLTVHVVSMCLFLGLVFMMDLRLARFGNLGTAAAEIQRRLFPWQMVGFVIVVVSGTLLFYEKPLLYYGKGFFWTKLALMTLAGANAGLIHWTTGRSSSAWDGTLARVAGIASIVLWAGVLITGRLMSQDWWTTEYF